MNVPNLQMTSTSPEETDRLKILYLTFSILVNARGSGLYVTRPCLRSSNAAAFTNPGLALLAKLYYLSI